MNRSKISEFTATPTMTIIEAMEKIDKNAKGVLFIVNADETLLGCITDGDIRRWLLKTGNLSSEIKNAMTSAPKTLFIDEKSKAKSIMQAENITAMPLLNKDKTIEEIVFLSGKEVSESDKNGSALEAVPVVIMAGGKGTRLYPYTKILPKPLIPIGETPIVERIIDCYVKYGVSQFYMTVNYKKEMIRSYFSDIISNYNISYVEENKPLGTGGSIKLIKDTLDKPFFVTNCDTLILADYSDIYKYHMESGNAITIVSALKNVIVPYGVLQAGKNGEVMSMEEKPKLSYFVNTGMYVINPEVVDLIPSNTFFHMTDLADAVMKQGDKVGMYPVSEDSFLDMGEFSEMKRMEEKLNIAEN